MNQQVYRSSWRYFLGPKFFDRSLFNNEYTPFKYLDRKVFLWYWKKPKSLPKSLKMVSLHFLKKKSKFLVYFLFAAGGGLMIFLWQSEYKDIADDHARSLTGNLFERVANQKNFRIFQFSVLTCVIIMKNRIECSSLISTKPQVCFPICQQSENHFLVHTCRRRFIYVVAMSLLKT